MMWKCCSGSLVSRNRTILIHPFPLFLFTFFVLYPGPSIGQTTYDMGEINGDTRVIGAERQDYLSHFCSINFNNSGVSDYIVCTGGILGRVEIYFDKESDYIAEKFDLRYEQPDIAINGGWVGSNTVYIGDTLRTGDINNDGLDDFVTSDYSHNQVFVYFGSPSWLSGTTLTLPKDPADLTIIHEIGAHPLNLGYDIEIGDINNDGIEDLVIGEYNAINGEIGSTGAINVIYGRENFTIYEVIDLGMTPADLTIYGANDGDDFGAAVAIGDINGDGVDDILTGAEWALAESDTHGRIYAIYGSSNFPVHHVINLATEPADIEIIGPHELSRTGWEVDVCDLNCDGVGDLCFTIAWLETMPQYRGAVFVVNGRNDFPPHCLIDLTYEEADLKILGEIENSYLGNALNSGDLDGNGCEDLAITGFNCQQRQDNEGVAYVFSGNPEYSVNSTIDLSVENASKTIFGWSPVGYMIYFSEMSDINQDGLVDTIVSAPDANREDDPWAISCGEIYVILSDGTMFNPPRYLGSPGFHQTNPAELRLYDPFDHEDWTGRYSPYLVQGYGLISAAGDLDGDGYDEMITGPGPGPDHSALVQILDHEGQRLEL